MFIMLGCIVSCEDNGLTNGSTKKKEELVAVLDGNTPVAMENRLGVTTCSDSTDRASCDKNNDGYCECTGSTCGRYCYDITYTLFRLVERGRICGSTSGCLVPNIEQLILTFHIDKLTQSLSVLMTEKNEIFAKSRLLEYDEKTHIATIGYDMVNADLAKSELFIQINANFINGDGKFISLNLMSEAIPPGHFQTK